MSQFKDDPERFGKLVAMTKLDLESRGLSQKIDLAYAYAPDNGNGAQGTLSVQTDSGKHYYRTDSSDPDSLSVNMRDR